MTGAPKKRPCMLTSPSPLTPESSWSIPAGTSCVPRSPSRGWRKARTASSFHTFRFHGVLAPHAAWRSQIIPGPQDDVDQEAAAEVARDVPVAVAGSPPSSRSSGLSWSALLKRVFARRSIHGQGTLAISAGSVALVCPPPSLPLRPSPASPWQTPGLSTALRILSLPDGRDPTSTYTPGVEHAGSLLP